MRALLARCVLLLPLLLPPWPAGAVPAPLPSTSSSPSPVDRLLDHHAEQGSSWQAWLLLDSEDDDSAELAEEQRQGGSAPRRITPKSVFIAPAFTPDQLPACADGYREDSMGRCVKVLRVNQAAHLDFLLRRLNAAYTPAKQNVAATAAQASPPKPLPQGPLKLPLPVVALPTSSTAPPASKPASAAASDPPAPKSVSDSSAQKPVSDSSAPKLAPDSPNPKPASASPDPKPASVSPAPKPTSDSPPPRVYQSDSDDAGAADMIISLFGGQEGSGGGGGDEDNTAVDPTVLSAGPPAEEVDVRDTLPMLVLTHTDSSSVVEDEIGPEPQKNFSEVVTGSAIQGESNSLPPILSTSLAPQVTLISDNHQHNAGGQMMRDASSVVAVSDSSLGKDQTPVSSSNNSNSPGASRKRTGVSVTDAWREQPIPSADTAKTVPVGTRHVDTSAVGSIPVSSVKTTHTGTSEISPMQNTSKKNSVRDPAQMEKQQGSHSDTFATGNMPDAHVGSLGYNSYSSPEVNNPHEWNGVTNRIPHTDNGYVRFPQGHGAGYVRFPVDAFQEQRNSGGSKLWWLQPGPNGWRVRHPDSRYRPALVRFFTRVPPPPQLHGQASWDTYTRHT